MLTKSIKVLMVSLCISTILSNASAFAEPSSIDISNETAVESEFTDEEIDLITIITMAEAEGESEEGQRLVIDVILNRLDSDQFPDTIHDVIYQKRQFSCVWNGRVKRCYVMEDVRDLVVEEIESRSNSDVIFFRTRRYSKYGSPLFKVGVHYFSSYD